MELVSWPVGLRANFREPLAGPRTIGASATQSVGGFIQTTASANGLWRWRFGFPPIRREMFRRYRGWVTSLHGGANATRVPFCDWDGLKLAERGIQVTSAERRNGVPWSNGLPWANGKNWKSGNPIVAVAEAAPLFSSEVRLADAFWGHGLDVGDDIGFTQHFGLYRVTKRIAPGHFRIWPPLHKALLSTSHATLDPVMAMRLEGEESANAPRDAAFASGLSVTLVQVPDYELREYI